MTIKISAIIIAKNVEDIIGDCIDSLKFCDEIIVVDNGSTDRTLELLKILEIKFYTFKSDNFSELRNFGLKKAKGKWILYIDADERVTDELKNNILDTINNRHPGKRGASASRISYRSNERDSGQARMTEFVSYKLNRKNFYLGNHEWPHIEKLERLFKKTSLKGWHGQVHETPIVKGEIGELDGFLLHYTHRDLTSMVDKTIGWSEIEAKLRFDANHPKMTWWRFPRVMITAFWDSYVKQKGYKAGTAGLIESIYQSFSMFITYAKLWEFQNEKRSEKLK